MHIAINISLIVYCLQSFYFNRGLLFIAFHNVVTYFSTTVSYELPFKKESSDMYFKLKNSSKFHYLKQFKKKKY